jgi:hypothetical protein
MLKCQRQNTHRRPLPTLGTIGRIVGLSTVNPRRKCMVVAYPLCDGALWRSRPMSLGIHTVWVRFLDDHSIQCFSAQWFEEA